MGPIPRAFVLALTAAGWCTASAVAGQDIPEINVPAHISAIEGYATLDRDDQSQAAVPNMPLVAGDRLRTDRGRLEVLFPDGSALDLDEFSSVELQAPTLLRLNSGRLLLTVAGARNPSSAALFQIDTPTASATTDGPGEYRIAILSGPSGLQTELAILRGAGALTTERASLRLRAGERSLVSEGDAPSYPQRFNSARLDSFDRWAAAARAARLASTESAQYLPADLRIYGGTFDRSGGWQYESPYGYVWYPTVSAGWRPYYNGYWATVPSYGWTWIGADVWSWPTHHYGRWGVSHSRWFWIPDRRWGAAWVSWGAAPGYVSWCPLGFDNRPVFGLSAGVRDQWAGWVVLPRRDFGRGHSVGRYAVSPRTLPTNTPFMVHAGPPMASSRVVARGNPASPVAVPRDPVFGRQSGTVSQPSTASGWPRDDRDRRGGSGAVARQPRTQPEAAGAAPTPRAADRRQAFPRGSNEASQPRAPQAIPQPLVPRRPDARRLAPMQPGTGESPTHPVYQVRPSRPEYQRRGPGGTTGGGAVARPPAANPSAVGPTRSPYVLSTPLGPQPSPFTRPAPQYSPPATRFARPPALPGSGAPAPRAIPRGAPAGAISGATPAPERSATPAQSRAARPRHAAPAAAQTPAQTAPQAAGRQHDPGSRRPR